MDPEILAILAFSIETVRNWVQDHGFWGGVAIVFGLLFACGLGLPLPEDIPLLVSGAFLISDARSWFIVGAACWAGIIGGDICLYALGHKYGMNITKVPFIGKHLTAERIQHVEKLFERYGVMVVAVGRLFAGIRGAMVVTAGTIRYNFAKFLIADGVAAFFSGGFFLVLGHWVGRSLTDETIQEFKHWFIAGAVVLVCMVLIWVIWRRRTGSTVSERIEQKIEQRIERKLEARAARSSDRPTRV
ncbi:MAG: DedA family protein [Phycisphaerae bacterium]|nr:DedA family protein [Phycisphaerae bacterium]MDW8263188.1 DedA family protein [Phycisphaerales bacterium]